MVATAEIPILTPRTLELLREAIPPDKQRILRDGLERVRPLFSSFLAEDDGEDDETFTIASSRYAHPRLQLLLVFLSSVDLLELPGMVQEVSHYASELLRREGLHLDKGAKLLREAWDAYGHIGRLLAQEFEALGQVTELPYGWLMALTRMDFSLTAIAMYLEGEFPNATRNRLDYLCQAALIETVHVMRLIYLALYPVRLAEQKLEILRGLFGSWQGDDAVDEDLRQLYESRRHTGSEPS